MDASKFARFVDRVIKAGIDFVAARDARLLAHPDPAIGERGW
jgi:hypothetical protein